MKEWSIIVKPLTIEGLLVQIAALQQDQTWFFLQNPSNPFPLPFVLLL